jgi:hypothetical protein
MNKLEQPCAEPVAWRYRFEDWHPWHYCDGERPDREGYEIEALYTEQPCAETGAAVSGWREEIAQVIYETWTDAPGYLSWVPRGNSHKQEDARRTADQILALLSPPPPSSHDGLRESSARADSAEPASLLRSTVAPEAEQAGLVEAVARAMCAELGINPEDWSETDAGLRVYAWELEVNTARAGILATGAALDATQLVARLNEHAGYGYMPAVVRDDLYGAAAALSCLLNPRSPATPDAGDNCASEASQSALSAPDEQENLPPLEASRDAEPVTLTVAEALQESAYLAGMKAGWNFGIAENKAGYLASVENRAGYLAPITAARRASRVTSRDAEPSGAVVSELVEALRTIAVQASWVRSEIGQTIEAIANEAISRTTGGAA